jgi:N-acetylmuramoyl-L-alanine amidase
MILSPGDSGEAVGQLQRRLGAAGFIPDGGVSPALFCTATEQAVRVFQEDRGLPITGVCDDVTWSALVEAAWSLGDRVLMLRSPNLRGDDVAELQRLLSRLGFDCGRIDGIFGPLAARAVSDFQLNAGLEVDGICRTGTVEVLRRLSRQTGDGPGIAAVREAESLRSGQPLDGRRVAIGQFGGFSALSRPLCVALRDRGALLIQTDDPDAAAQAAHANLFGAEVYVGLEASAERMARITYYSVPAFESSGGRALAHLTERHLRDVVPRIAVSGMRLPILRETKMPAVLLTLGPTQLMVERAERIAEAVFLALTAWSA